MNLKGFKKVYDSGDHAILKNDKGHEIRIAKNGLTSKHRKDLEALSIHANEGVDTQPSLGVDTTMPQPDQSMLAQPQQSPEQPVDSGESSQMPPATLKPDEDVQRGQQIASPQPQPQSTPEQASVQQSGPQTPGDFLVDQMQKVSQDLSNNKITPKTYQDLLFKDQTGKEKSTLGKIGTLFGLMAAGAGSGLTGQPNVVMGMMDNEIKNDLESQKQNRETKTNYFNFLQNAIEHQSAAAKNYADIAHLAVQDSPTMDALTQAHARRDYLDKLYNDQVLVYPEGTPQRQKAEQTFGMLMQGVNAADQSAAAFVNGRWNLYKGQPGMMGGPGSASGNAGTGGQGPRSPDQGIDYSKWNELKAKNALKLQNAPTDSDLDKISKEAVDVLEARQIRKTYLDSFNKLNNMYLAGKLNPNQRAAEVNALGAKMATLTSHRYNAGEAATQAEGMFPKGDDWGGKNGKTRQIKLQKGLESIDALEAGTPMMNFYGLKTKPQSPALTTSHPPDGTTINLSNGKKGVWKNGKRYYQ